MKFAKFFLGTAALLLAFSASADHRLDPYNVARAATIVKQDAENLLINMARDRSPQVFQLINKTGMLAKEANDVEELARRNGGDFDRETQDVVRAFRELTNEFRSQPYMFRLYGSQLRRLSFSVQDLKFAVYGSQGNDDGFDGRDGFDGQDGFDGHDDGHDGFGGRDGQHN